MGTTSASVLAALAFLLTGCHGDAGPAAIGADELPRLVLQPQDVGAGWIQFADGPETRPAPPEALRGEVSPRGRVGGWAARYRRPPAVRLGALVIESRAEVFEDDEAAESHFDAQRAAGIADAPAEALPAPSLGDEAAAVTFTQRGAIARVRFYLIVWREENATASLLVQGFATSLGREDAVRLAEQQQARMARAAD